MGAVRVNPSRQPGGWKTGAWVAAPPPPFLHLLLCTFKPNPTSLFVSLSKENWKKEGEGQLTGTADHNRDWLLVLPLLQVGSFSWEKHQGWDSVTRAWRPLCLVCSTGSPISVGAEFDLILILGSGLLSGFIVRAGSGKRSWWLNSQCSCNHTAVYYPGSWSPFQPELAALLCPQVPSILSQSLPHCASVLLLCKMGCLLSFAGGKEERLLIKFSFGWLSHFPPFLHKGSHPHQCHIKHKNIQYITWKVDLPLNAQIVDNFMENGIEIGWINTSSGIRELWPKTRNPIHFTWLWEPVFSMQNTRYLTIPMLLNASHTKC